LIFAYRLRLSGKARTGKNHDELIDLQNRWKEIGPVPRKHYDPVWKRFRAACDHFFNSKSEFFSTIDSKYEENLEKKLA
jgi:hypothetical protein